MRGCRRICLALALLATAPVRAAIADCDGDIARTLHPVVHAATDARAYLLDAGTLRWPNMPATAGYRLYASADARLQVVAGQPVRGADIPIVLQPVSALADALAQPLRFTGGRSKPCSVSRSRVLTDAKPRADKKPDLRNGQKGGGVRAAIRRL